MPTPLRLAPPTGPRRPTRQFAPRLAKPVGSYCDGCVLRERGKGYVPAVGAASPLLFVGENPWYDEIAAGEPFYGASGAMLAKILRLIGHTREEIAIDNVLRCAPPEGKIERFPGAVAACHYIDDEIAARRPRVIVPMGTQATRRLLNLPKLKHGGVENFHGTVTWAEGHHAWVVPTFHSAHLVRGATNLMGVVAFDLTRAWSVATDGWDPDPAMWIVNPPVEWFRQWARAYVEAVQSDGPYAYPLGTDIETPEKGPDEATLIGTQDDATYQITQVNLSYHPDEGVTVPFEPGYIEILRDLFAAQGVMYYWYKGYDYPRLRKAQMPIAAHLAWDCMWMWKALQSDVPQGLGFAAPFYSRFGAWKHLNETEPLKYAAIDGFQTRRVGDGVVADLQSAGRWHVFERHMHDWHRTALAPATAVGIPIDRARLTEFKLKLDGHAQRFLAEMQAHVPADLLPCTPKDGLTRPPAEGVTHTKSRTTKRDGTAKKDLPDALKVELYARARVVEKLVLREVTVCRTCGTQEVAVTHNCQPKLKGQEAATARPILEKVTASVRRWFWQEPFNPDSVPQLMAYVTAKGHQPGKSKHTGNDSVDRETLNRLIRETGDPLYQSVVDYRAVQKINGTYVTGTFKRLDADDRVHPETTFKASTMRTTQVNPNYQNVVADKGEVNLASGFRTCVVARGRETDDAEYQDRAPAVWSSCRLVEADFSGIEAVILGWFMRSPSYIRLGKLGMHAYVASHMLKRPADLHWTDQALAAYFKEIKGSDDPATATAYKQAKRTVHGKGYGLTVHGVLKNNPKLFKTLKEAQYVDDVYTRDCAPDLPPFHAAVKQTAHDFHRLGGPETYDYLPYSRRVIGHPYAYQHWFWSVVTYKRLTEAQKLWRAKRREPYQVINGIPYAEILGDDANRALAFYPQSTARGVLAEACFPLFDPDDPLFDYCYVGDLYYGQTPLRAPIHDSLFFECPTRKVDTLIERVAYAMQRPIEAMPCPAEWELGQYLTVGVDAKIGDDWGSMSALAIPSLTDLGVANDAPFTPAEADDEEDVAALEVAV